MKKIIAVLLCILLAISLEACSAKRPANITAVNSGDTLPASAVFATDGLWPENTYTQDIPVPPGKIVWSMLDTEAGFFSIQLNGLSKEAFDAYYQSLLAAGFTETEKVEKDGKRQPLVSIGSLISDGRRSVSFAFFESILVMTVTNQPTGGSPLKFLELRTMSNVYVNAYSTYDTEDGIQVITELYVPEGETPKPAFTSVQGIVTVTVGGRTTTHCLNAAESTDALGITVNTKVLGASGEKGTVVIAGTALADNAAAGGGSFCIFYEITLP